MEIITSLYNLAKELNLPDPSVNFKEDTYDNVLYVSFELLSEGVSLGSIKTKKDSINEFTFDNIETHFRSQINRFNNTFKRSELLDLNLNIKINSIEYIVKNFRSKVPTYNVDKCIYLSMTIDGVTYYTSGLDLDFLYFDLIREHLKRHFYNMNKQTQLKIIQLTHQRDELVSTLQFSPSELTEEEVKEIAHNITKINKILKKLQDEPIPTTIPR